MRRNQAWSLMPLLTHLGGKSRRISEFEASLLYRVTSRTARATQRNPVSKTNETKQKREESSNISSVKQQTSNIKRKVIMYFSITLIQSYFST